MRLLFDSSLLTYVEESGPNVDIPALLNYNWSKSPEQLRNPVNKAIAVLMVAVMWASSGWYFKRGVTNNGVAVAIMGALQAYSSLRE